MLRPAGLLAAFLALPAITLAVTLDDFTPRVSNLSSSCQTVYTETINGCSPSDFAPGPCSAGCIQALENFTPTVQAACSNQGIPGDNVLYAFLNDVGPQSICNDTAGVLTSSSSSTTSTTSTSASASSRSPPSSTDTGLSSSPITSSIVASPTTSTASDDSVSSTTSSTTPTKSTTQSESPSKTSSSAASSSTSKSGAGEGEPDEVDPSGGGSPFDTLGNLAFNAATGVGCPATWILATGVMMMAWWNLLI